MLVERNRLINHLQRIAVGGIKEAVVTGAFASAAKEPSVESVFVLAAGLQGVEDLPKAIGLSNVDLIVKTLRKLPADVNDVELKFEGSRLCIDSNGVEYRFVVLDPSATASRLDDAIVDAVLSFFPDSVWNPLPAAGAASLKETYDLLKSEEISFFVGETFAVRVGEEVRDFAWLSFGTNPNPPKDKLTVSFNAKTLSEVLGTIRNVDQAQFAVSNPTPNNGRLLGIKEGSYCYILAPSSNG